MTEQDDPSTRVSEARALFTLNQQRRVTAEQTLLTAYALPAVGATIAIATGRRVILLPIPSLVLLLHSLAFQHYVEVSVLGAARAKLEQEINTAAQRPDLIYETHVSPIRQGPPLVGSLRVLQTLARGMTAGITVTGCALARREGRLARRAYLATTALATASCALSYRDMLRASRVAEDRLEQSFGRGAAPP